MSTVAPITDEELADIEAPGLTAPDSTVRRLAARIRATERERDEAQRYATELQAVVDAYGKNGATVCVRAGDNGEVDMWSDGHAHAMAPLSSLKTALRERDESRDACRHFAGWLSDIVMRGINCTAS